MIKEKIQSLYSSFNERFDSDKYCDTVLMIYLIYMSSSYGIYRFVPFLTRSGISQILAIVMAGLVFSTVLLRIRRLPLKYCAVFYFMLTAILLSMLSPNSLIHIKSTILADNAIKEVWVFPLAFMVGDDPSRRLSQLRIAAYAGLISYSSAMLLGAVPAANYMSFGYGIILWWAIIAQSLFVNKGTVSRLVDFAFIAISGVTIVMYANRTALLIIAAVLAACVLLYTGPVIRFTFLGVSVLSIAAVVLLFDQLIALAINITDALGISSRNLHLLLTGSFGDASHRMNIYSTCIDMIMERFPFGYGISGERFFTLANGLYANRGASGAYAHNILLELCVNYGGIMGIALFAGIIYMAVRMFSKSTDTQWKALFMPLYICSMMQMMFSSTVYVVGSFWAAMMVYFSYEKFASHRRIEGRLRFA